MEESNNYCINCNKIIINTCLCIIDNEGNSPFKQNVLNTSRESLLLLSNDTLSLHAQKTGQCPLQHTSEPIKLTANITLSPLKNKKPSGYFKKLVDDNEYNTNNIDDSDDIDTSDDNDDDNDIESNIYLNDRPPKKYLSLQSSHIEDVKRKKRSFLEINDDDKENISNYKVRRCLLKELEDSIVY